MNTPKHKCAICLKESNFNQLLYCFKKKQTKENILKAMKNPKSIKMIHPYCARYYQSIIEEQVTRDLKVFTNGFFIQALYLENCIICHKGPVSGQCLIKCSKKQFFYRNNSSILRKCRKYFHNQCAEINATKYIKQQERNKFLYYCEKHKPTSYDNFPLFKSLGHLDQLMEIEKQKKLDEEDEIELDEIFEELHDINQEKKKYVRQNQQKYLKQTKLKQTDILNTGDNYQFIINKFILCQDESNQKSLNNLGKKSRNKDKIQIKPSRARVKSGQSRQKQLKNARSFEGRIPRGGLRTRSFKLLSRKQDRRALIKTLEQFLRDVGSYRQILKVKSNIHSKDPDAFWDFIDYIYFNKLNEESEKMLQNSKYTLNNQFQSNQFKYQNFYFRIDHSRKRLRKNKLIPSFTEEEKEIYTVLISKKDLKFLSKFHYSTTSLRKPFTMNQTKSIQVLKASSTKSLTSYLEDLNKKFTIKKGISDSEKSKVKFDESLLKNDPYKQKMTRFNQESQKLIRNSYDLKLMNFKEIPTSRFHEIIRNQIFMNKNSLKYKYSNSIDIELEYLQQEKELLETKIVKKLKTFIERKEKSDTILSNDYNEKLILKSEQFHEQYTNIRINQLIKQGMKDKFRKDIKVQSDENVVEKNQFQPEEEKEKEKEEEKKKKKRKNFYYTVCQVCFSGLSSEINPICYCSGQYFIIFLFFKGVTPPFINTAMV